MTGIRKDLLGSLPQELQGANDQLKAFIGTFQQFLGALNQVTGQLGNTIKNVADQGGSSNPTFLTPQGQSAHSDFLDTLSGKLATDAYARSIERRGKGEMIPGIGGRVAFSQPIAEVGGVKIHTAFTDNSNNRAINDLQRQIRVGLDQTSPQEQARYGARFGVQASAGGSVVSQFGQPLSPPQQQALQPRSSYLGYTMADLPRVGGINTGDVNGQLAKTIDGLKNSDDANSKATIRVLEGIKAELSKQANEFGKARDAFVMAADTKDPELKTKTHNELIEALAKLDQTLQQAGTAQKGVGGGPGPTGPGMGAMMGKGFGIAGGLIGAGLAGYQFYAQSALSQDRIIMDAELNKQQAQGRISQYGFRSEIESHDMTKTDNILRYRGNMFLPGSKQGQFFGSAEALARSQRAAGERGQIGIDIDKQERTSGVVGGVGSMLLGALAVAGGFAVGGPIGAGIAGVAAGGMIGGLANKAANGTNQATGVAGNYLSNPYTTYSGDLTSGLSGSFGEFRRGGQFERLGDTAVQAARFGKLADSHDYARAIQDAEMSKFGRERMAIDQKLGLIQTNKEGAMLVGEYAATGDQYYDRATNARIPGAISREIAMGRSESNTPEARQLNREVQKVNHGAAIFSDIKKYGTSTPSRRARFFQDLDDNAQGSSTPFFDSLIGRAADYWVHGSDAGDPEKETASVKKSKREAGLAYMRASSRGIADNFAQIRGSELVAGDGGEFNSSRLARAVRMVETGKAEGDYGAVNKFGMVGAYQIDPKTWNATAQSRYGMSVQDMVGNKEMQDKFYKEVLGPSFKQQALSLQRRNGTAALLPTELLAGLNQLGAGNVESYLNTGSMINGNSVNNPGLYLSKLSKHTGIGIPQAFYDALGTHAPTPPGETQRPNLPTGPAAALEMSAGEYLSSKNQLTNYLGSSGGLGSGLRASDSQTTELIRLGRSGLGSFDQHLGTLGAINQVAGGQDNTKTLEVTLSQAVAAGFDKSRTAQKFMQNTTSIAESLKLTNIANTGALLGTASRLTSGSGQPDERSLALGAQGIQSYGAFTGNQAGLSGALTAIGLSNAGFHNKNGGGIISKLSAPQMTDFIKTLEGKGEINDIALQSLLQESGMSKTELASKLRDVRKTTIAPITTTLDQRLSGRSFNGVEYKSKDDFLSKIKDMGDSKKAAEAIKQMSRAAYAATANSGIGGEGFMASLADDMVVAGVGQYTKNLTEGKKSSGNRIFVDPANQQRLKFMENITAQFSAETKGALDPAKAKALYFESVAQGHGATRMIDVGGKQMPLTQQNYDSGSAAYKSAADQEFKGMNTFDIARGMEDKFMQENHPQLVRIANISEMVERMFQFGVGAVKKEPNVK